MVGVGVASDVGEVEVGNSLIETVFVKHFDMCQKTQNRLYLVLYASFLTTKNNSAMIL